MDLEKHRRVYYKMAPRTIVWSLMFIIITIIILNITSSCAIVIIIFFQIYG